MPCKVTPLSCGVLAGGLFDDLNRFLESRLEEFCEKSSFGLEALLEQLREKEKIPYG